MLLDRDPIRLDPGYPPTKIFIAANSARLRFDGEESSATFVLSAGYWNAIEVKKYVNDTGWMTMIVVDRER